MQIAMALNDAKVKRDRTKVDVNTAGRQRRLGVAGFLGRTREVHVIWSGTKAGEIPSNQLHLIFIETCAFRTGNGIKV